MTNIPDSAFLRPVPRPPSARMSPAEIAPSAPFLKLVRSDAAESLLRYPNCFVVLTLVSLRARREAPAFNPAGLREGEALVGDFAAVGLSRQEFRTAIANLEKWGFVTIRTTTRGTIAKLCNSVIYDINSEATNQPANQQPTSSQPAANQQLTTKKKERKKERKEGKEASSLRSEDAASAADVPAKKNSHENQNAFQGAAANAVHPQRPPAAGNPDVAPTRRVAGSSPLPPPIPATASASHTRGASDVGTSVTPRLPTPAASGEPEHFPAFWAVWPKKEGRLDAARAFAKLPADDQAAAAGRAAAWLTAHPDLSDPGRFRFIPYASTWLNQQRWTDEAHAIPATAFNSAPHANASFPNRPAARGASAHAARFAATQPAEGIRFGAPIAGCLADL